MRIESIVTSASFICSSPDDRFVISSVSFIMMALVSGRVLDGVFEATLEAYVLLIE